MVAHEERPGRPAGRRAGQALVEFALVVPLLLLLVMGVVEFGRAWNVRQTLTDAAREGARTAVLANPAITIDTVAARVKAVMGAAGLDTAAAQVTAPGFGVSRGQTTVTVSYPYTFSWLSGLMGWTGAQTSFNMASSVVFRNEY